MQLRKAQNSDVEEIWEIIQFAIAQRKADGSDQWQNGYPNVAVLKNDIENDFGFVLEENGTILLYAAIIFEEDPAYNEIDGEWLTNGDYVVLHRVATSEKAIGRGIGNLFFKMVEDLCLSKEVYSIKVDTSFDNFAMLKIMERLNYTYCGEVQMSGGPRKAFEKVLR